MVRNDETVAVPVPGLEILLGFSEGETGADCEAAARICCSIASRLTREKWGRQKGRLSTMPWSPNARTFG